MYGLLRRGSLNGVNGVEYFNVEAFLLIFPTHQYSPRSQPMASVKDSKAPGVTMPWLVPIKITYVGS